MKNFALGFLAMYSILTTTMCINDIKKDIARKEEVLKQEQNKENSTE